MASRCTVADHLQPMIDRFTVLSSTITEITSVNSTLEELVENDSALVDSFGDPEDPIVKFNTENFKQAVREAIISSGGVRDTIKNLARYASNTDHIQRIKDDLNVPQQESTSGHQTLKRYLTIINQRINTCRKNVGKMQPLYEKVSSVVMKHNHPPLESVARSTSTVPMLQRIARNRSISTFFRFQGLFDVASISIVVVSALFAHALYPMSKQHSIKSLEQPIVESLGQAASAAVGAMCVSPFAGAQQVYPVCGAGAGAAVAPSSHHSLNWNPGDKSTSGSVRMYILGILCLGFGILGLRFLLIRAFRSGQGDEERSVSQPSAPPIAKVVDLQSAGVVVSAFLAKLEDFKSQLLDLEECVGEAAKCQNSGNIREIEEQLQKVKVDMESIITAALT